jgi:alkaline phosphatase D
VLKFVLWLFVLLLSSCSLLESFIGPSALDTDQFIKAIELLRQNRKVEAFVKFDSACKGKVIAACLYLHNEIPQSKLKPTSIMQGMSGKTEVLLSLAFQHQKNIIFEVFDVTSGRLVNAESIKSKEQTWPGHLERLLTLRLSQLETGHEYRLEIYNGDHKLQDVRWFTTLAPNAKNFNYIVASCMYDKYSKIQKNMWNGVSQMHPEALFLIGDNAYLDTKKDRSEKITAGHIWSRFMDHRINLDLYYYKNLIPVFALWDDHDYGLNNGNKNFELKAEATQLFKSFFPYYNIKEAQAGHGVGYKLTLAKSNYYFLDARSFRDDQDKNTKKNGTHFGNAQEKWLYKHLNRDNSHSFLIKGDQFFGGYHPYESYQLHHPYSFEKFLKMVGKLKSPVFFVSGDRHLTEIMEINKPDFAYTTYEMTSSGIHSSVYGGSYVQYPNKRMLVGVDGENNFTYVNSNLEGKKLLLDITSFGIDRKVLYSKRLEFKK